MIFCLRKYLSYSLSISHNRNVSSTLHNKIYFVNEIVAFVEEWKKTYIKSDEFEKDTKEYFNNLEEQYDLILENSNYEETIFDIISKYGIIKNKLEDKNKINIVLEKSIKMSDRFLLEKELNNKISYISFNDNNLNIQKL